MANKPSTPKITVRNLKHNESLSEETHCFSATVYVDGKRFCTARNHGHGGPDEYAPVGKGTDWRTLRAQIEEVGARLPDDDDGYDFDAMSKFEIAVGEAVNRALIERETKKELNKKVLAVVDGSLKQFQAKAGSQRGIDEIARGVETQYPGAVVLNRLPIEQAADIVRAWDSGRDINEAVAAVRQPSGDGQEDAAPSMGA